MEGSEIRGLWECDKHPSVLQSVIWGQVSGYISMDSIPMIWTCTDPYIIQHQSQQARHIVLRQYILNKCSAKPMCYHILYCKLWVYNLVLNNMLHLKEFPDLSLQFDTQSMFVFHSTNMNDSLDLACWWFALLMIRPVIQSFMKTKIKAWSFW